MKKSRLDSQNSKTQLDLDITAANEPLTVELGAERALRPKRLSEYLGQPFVSDQLSLFLQAAKTRGQTLDHVLLFGPPGLGKTTLAMLIAAEMGVELIQTSGAVLERGADLAALLTQLPPGAVLFIDEIHRLPAIVEEILYPAMEDYRLDIRVGEGAESKTLQIPLAPFTLVGATTRAGALTAPFRDRFGITGRLQYYETADLAKIVERSARLVGCPLSVEACLELASRSRGTPRIANRLLRRLVDVVTVRLPGQSVSAQFAREAMDLLGVDETGLNECDRRLLSAMQVFYGGGPVGVDTLAAITGEASDTLEDVVEPYLMQQGLLQRTPRGRVLTDAGRAYAARIPIAFN